MNSHSLLHVLIEESEISECQEKLSRKLRAAGEPKKINAGYRGGSNDIDAYWFSKYNFWWGYDKLQDSAIPRHWNAFGYLESSSELDDPGSRIITCEINSPLSKNDWRVTGAFVKDESGQAYIVHTGGIGGGRREVGMGWFKENFGGEWIDVIGRRGKRKVVKVSLLDDVNLVANLGRFVRQVHEIKEILF